MCTVLQFSGGRDSLACLYLLEPRWEEITVAWVNTGMPFPETLEQMERIKSMVPHFLEISGQQNIEREGYPTDVLPIAATSLGHQFEGSTGARFQSRYSCCAAALWAPMQQAMRELGATTIIRGQKLSDDKKTPIRSGTVIEGVTYEFPLEAWTDEDVQRYLNERGVKLPQNYRYMSTGLDCWNCTAYLTENAGRLEYMEERHPQKYQQVRAVLTDLFAIIDQHIQPLREIP